MSIIYAYLLADQSNKKPVALDMPLIQHEIKQTRSFASAGQEAVISLLRTAALVRRRFEALCEEYGLTFQQFNVLRILRGAERSGEGSLPTMEVAERMIEPEPGITRMMERLEKKGLVCRERCTKDARRMLCRITRQGHDTIEQLDAPITHLDEVVLRPLADEELRTLTSLLDRAREPASS
jgi:DNA-binding MarR family transcriptional regulator